MHNDSESKYLESTICMCFYKLLQTPNYVALQALFKPFLALFSLKPTYVIRNSFKMFMRKIDHPICHLENSLGNSTNR